MATANITKFDDKDLVCGIDFLSKYLLDRQLWTLEEITFLLCCSDSRMVALLGSPHWESRFCVWKSQMERSHMVPPLLAELRRAVALGELLASEVHNQHYVSPDAAMQWLRLLYTRRTDPKAVGPLLSALDAQNNHTGQSTIKKVVVSTEASGLLFTIHHTDGKITKHRFKKPKNAGEKKYEAVLLILRYQRNGGVLLSDLARLLGNDTSIYSAIKNIRGKFGDQWKDAVPLVSVRSLPDRIRFNAGNIEIPPELEADRQVIVDYQKGKQGERIYQRHAVLDDERDSCESE